MTTLVPLMCAAAGVCSGTAFNLGALGAHVFLGWPMWCVRAAGTAVLGATVVYSGLHENKRGLDLDTNCKIFFLAGTGCGMLFGDLFLPQLFNALIKFA